MKFYMPLFICIQLICSCNNKIKVNDELNKVIEKHTKSYQFIDSLGYTELYNDVRWEIFLKYCDKKVLRDSNRDSLEYEYYLGESNDYLFHAQTYQDTLLNFSFSFFIEDSIKIYKGNYQFEDSSMMFNFYNNIYFNIEQKSIYGYGIGHYVKVDTSGKELKDYCNGVPNCDEEKKKFIIKNRNKLNKWFVEEAIKRGFIEKKWWWVRW